MNATRTERVTVNLDPDLLARLDRFARERRWTRSTAVAVLIERGLDAESPPDTAGGR